LEKHSAGYLRADKWEGLIYPARWRQHLSSPKQCLRSYKTVRRFNQEGK